LLAVVAGGVVLLCAPAARAEEPDVKYAPYGWLERRLPGPRNAIEIDVATGYTQGLGSLRAGTGMSRVATGGVALELGAGYRIDPRWAVGMHAQYGELASERARAARTLMVSAGATYHFSPARRLAPFAQLSAGYRMLWETHINTPDLLSHGFQLARATGGLDVRLSRAVAIAPVAGADVSMFLWQMPSNASARAIPRPALNVFAFVGVQGRFDLLPVPTAPVRSADLYY
jgi:hypothetical protein